MGPGMGRLHGKVALVTGAGSGLGRAAAVALAREGARVVASDVAGEAAAETARLARESGVEAAHVVADVTRDADARAAVDVALERFGRLDVALNSAGVEGTPALTPNVAESEWDRVLAVNLKGVWLSMRHEIPAMLAGGGGSIVNVASVLGLVGTEGAAPYAAAKHGVVGLTRTAALEYARRGVRVNAVCPAFVETPMVTRVLGEDPRRRDAVLARHPIGRFGRPEEVAALVVWLASEEASFVTGAALPVDGAYSAQ